MGVDLRDHISGCMLAGAVGDALGGPVEFSELGRDSPHRQLAPGSTCLSALRAGGTGTITWLNALDGRELIAQLAADAATQLLEPPWHEDFVPQEWWDRYPGW